MKASSAGVHERAVRMVGEHAGDHASEWAAMQSIAEKVRCTPDTLDLWVRQGERDRGERASLFSDERARLKALEREVRGLRQANEIQREGARIVRRRELDRRWKRDRGHRR